MVHNTLVSIQDLDMNVDEQYLFKKLQQDYQTNVDAVGICTDVLVKTIPKKEKIIRSFICLYPEDDRIIKLQQDIQILKEIQKELHDLPVERAQTCP
jgi:hypothetical protein